MGTLIGVHTIVPGMRVLCQLENCSVIVRVSPPAVASKIGLFWMWNWLKNGVSIPSQAVLVYMIIAFTQMSLEIVVLGGKLVCLFFACFVYLPPGT